MSTLESAVIQSPNSVASGGKGTPISVCLLGAAFGTTNFGLGALAGGTVEALQRSFPECELFLVDYGRAEKIFKIPACGRTVTVPLRNIRFSKNVLGVNHVARLNGAALMGRMLPSPCRRQISAMHPRLAEMQRARAVLSLARGDSFSDLYGLRRLFYVALPQLLTLASGRPLVLLPQTYGPFNTALGRSVARFIFSKARFIFARDRSSAELVRRLVAGRSARVETAIDMGFALAPRRDPAHDHFFADFKDRTLVGLNVSGLLLMGGYTRDNMFGLKSEYARTLDAVLKALIVDGQCNVLLVPHVFGDRPGSESDVPACRQIAGEYEGRYGGRIRSLSADFEPDTLKHVIGQCDFFLGSRMHACIAALSQAVPAVGLAYSDKFAGVLESAGAGDLVIDLRKVEAEEVGRGIGALLAQRHELRERLMSGIPAVRAAALDFFERPDLRDLLRHRTVA